MKAPIILTPTAEARAGTRKLLMNRAYADAIERAGGIIIATGRPKLEKAKDALIELADGLLFMGGDDICPEFYNEGNRNCKNIDRERDDLELALLHKAITKKIPILAICRGMQLLNIAFHGTLYQDVAKEMPGADTHDFHNDKNGAPLERSFLAHDVTIEKDSTLYHMTGQEHLKVNSLHHQGIKKLGEGLSASARAPDGLVEALEIKNYPFGIGIEWHPEELGDKVSQNIFQAFVDAARTE
ncbi:MAG: gamma-glutamyl-gamma-aminobutyrate hydrolase family protein [bacterium]|nr:gamma-glutamyl-gamma-aminobutyrate hydrolase family protein [bacterium]